MSEAPKPVRLSRHAGDKASDRGTSLAEIEEAIHESPWTDAQEGRLECSHDFVYQAEWRGKFYATKRIRPIFVEEATEIVVITVYTLYF